MIIFCIIYYVFSYLRFIPQIFKLIQTKSSNDYSVTSEIIRYFAILSWSIYLFTSNQQAIVIIGSILDMTLLTITTVLIILYCKN